MKFDFIKNFKWFIGASGVIILAAIIVTVFAGGLVLGIDFTGGTMITLAMNEEFSLDTLEEVTREQVSSEVRVSYSGSDGAIVYINDRDVDADLKDEVRGKITDAIVAAYPSTVIEYIDSVGPVAGSQLIYNAFMSLALAGVLMLIYIWIRFELLSGVAAVIALLHDVAIMISIVAILRVQINSSFIAAVLTIVGYSINNTIVVFDRIRDNRKVNRTLPFEQVANKSVGETLGRSINTSLTTLITITLVYIFGVASIREFVLPIITGLLAGTYSSIFIVSGLWVRLHNMAAKARKNRAVKSGGKNKKKAKA